MKIGDEVTLATRVRDARRRKLWSQSELAEQARVSTKTVQRLEAGATIAGSSRRAVLEALGMDAERVRPAVSAAAGEPANGTWAPIDDARSLLQHLADATNVDIEVDRDGWRQAWRSRAWYKQGIYIAFRDPVHRLLELADGLLPSNHLPPGQRAKQEDKLANALRELQMIDWSLAYRFDADGALSLYIGSPTVAAERIATGG